MGPYRQSAPEHGARIEAERRELETFVRRLGWMPRIAADGSICGVIMFGLLGLLQGFMTVAPNVGLVHATPGGNLMSFALTLGYLGLCVAFIIAFLRSRRR